VIANAQIVEVAVMAWIVLGEGMNLQRILAALLILFGVTLVQAQGTFRPELPAPVRRLEAAPGAD